MVDGILKHKFYKPISQEKIKEAVEEINKERYEFIDVETLIAEDQFVILYRDGDKTSATQTDISLHSAKPPGSSAEISYASIQSNENGWFALAKENWFVTIPVILFAIWIIGKYFI